MNSRRPIVYSIVILLGFLVLVCSCNTETYLGRWFTWRASDIEDYLKFPAYEFDASQKPFEFIENNDPTLDALQVIVKGNKMDRLSNVLDGSGTTAFLVIRNDTILYEDYFNGYYRASFNTSFSVAKSITSLIAGKLIDDGLITSVEDHVTDYIPELEALDPDYKQVKISHLLNMRSGIQFKDHDLPWGDKPKAYYNPNLRERVLELPVINEPGTIFQYNSYNPILVGMIIERVTGQSPARYFEEKVWNKMGMEYSGSWSMDSEESGMTKMESGINLRAVDFAKFGRLILNRGDWNGNQIISQTWMDSYYEVGEEYRVDEFGSDMYYRNFCWIYGNDEKDADIISGWGHLGQYLYVFPEEGMIIVRMGKKTGKVESWGRIFREIVENQTGS